jgi:hypothetical protein
MNNMKDKIREKYNYLIMYTTEEDEVFKEWEEVEISNDNIIWHLWVYIWKYKSEFVIKGFNFPFTQGKYCRKSPKKETISISWKTYYKEDVENAINSLTEIK